MVQGRWPPPRLLDSAPPPGGPDESDGLEVLEASGVPLAASQRRHRGATQAPWRLAALAFPLLACGALYARRLSHGLFVSSGGGAVAGGGDTASAAVATGVLRRRAGQRDVVSLAASQERSLDGAAARKGPPPGGGAWPEPFGVVDAPRRELLGAASLPSELQTCSGDGTDVDFLDGRVLLELPDIRAAKDCAESCRVQQRCSIWTWSNIEGVEGLTHVCTLKELETGRVAVKVPRRGVVSGILAQTPCQEPRQLANQAAREVGLVKSHGGLCLHAMDWATEGSEVRMWSCFLSGPQSSHQLWKFDGLTGHIMNQAGLCLMASRGDREFSNVTIKKCDDADWSQNWMHDSVSGIVKMKHGICLHSPEQGRQGGVLYMRACDAKNPKQLWRIGTASTILRDDSFMHPRHSLAASMFCFALMMPDSYEQNLLKFQHGEGTGIFGCSEYAVYSNSVIEVAEGVKTHVVDSTLKCGKGGEFGTALNTDIFLALWAKVLDEGRFMLHGWTAKVDPDAVFLPNRLRSLLTRHSESPQGAYLNNCKMGMHGPVEVFSRNALQAFGRGKDHCLQHFTGLCSGPCKWGEDMFLDQCLWKVLNVTREFEWALLQEDHCDPPPGWQACNAPGIAAFHPFKTVKGYQECLGSASAVDAA
mmetsp:Transcript_31192/g.83443  ORF Transcript_31192/g.83443 Transcript_31192/m.83443 type:complete len:647 (-) Transcript_31192:159-2099(-)